MQHINNYIESGILELYVLDIVSDIEKESVENMMALHPEIREEVEQISLAIEAYLPNAVAPDPTIKPFLMAVIDYTERLKNGEQPSFPPMLSKDSLIADYSTWINREDMRLQGVLKDIYAKIIGYTPEATTVIVWIKDMAPQEVHDCELEKFLVLEGSCDITVEEEIHHLFAGDFLSIPLFKRHDVKITSLIPCKIILQRIAA